MTEKQLSNRRDFIKTAAVGAAGITAAKFDRLFAAPGAWINGMQINPAIDNKRVICCHDMKMITSTPKDPSWANQNKAVDANAVASNMDEMAKLLAKKTTAAEAWSAIFRSGKPWASTKVAIKTNAIQGPTGNHPRVAIIKKLCDVFVDQLKVPAANIILYDANADAAASYSTYAGLTDATKIRATVSTRAQSLGGMTPVAIAASTKNISAPADLVNGVIDVLVDICTLKVHSGPGISYGFGSCSLCMKGHLGTFINQGTDAAPSSTGLHVLDAIFNINKHVAILGGNPVRQQLCIVDGLLANGGNSAIWSVRADRIVMGTFAPIVDYLTATKLLLNATIMAAGPMPALGATNAAINLPKFLTSFGYTTTDALDWVEFVPGVGIVNPPSHEYSGRLVKVSLSNPSFKRTTAQILIPHTAGAMCVGILDCEGRLVRTFLASLNETIISWNGLSDNGTTVSAGNYLVEIVAGGIKRTGNIIVTR